VTVETASENLGTGAGTGLDSAHVGFLIARLNDEIEAARTRRGDDRGLRLMVELRSELDSGQRSDQMSIDLLTVAYSRHPDFRLDWNRWHRE